MCGDVSYVAAAVNGAADLVISVPEPVVPISEFCLAFTEAVYPGTFAQR